MESPCATCVNNKTNCSILCNTWKQWFRVKWNWVRSEEALENANLRLRQKRAALEIERMNRLVEKRRD